MPGENVSWCSRIPRIVSIARREYGFARGGRAGGGGGLGRRRLVARLDVGCAHLVDERTMHADEVRARGLGIRGGRRSEPAHELRDGGIDVPVEEEPAVVGERIARVVGEAAHDPVVHVPDRVARQHEQVRRVKVRVEVPVDEHLVEHVPVEVAHDPVRVVAARPQRREVVGVLVPRRNHDIVERGPLDELRGEDPRRRVVTMHASDALEAFADCVLMKERSLARLDEIVELVRRPARNPSMTCSEFVPPNGRDRWMMPLTAYIGPISDRKSARIPGRWTLTATRSPVGRTARWTWPIEAAANDRSSNAAKTSSGGAPNSSVTIEWTSS